MTRVACIGEAMIELCLDGDAARVAVAGDTLNTAIYLKRSAPEIEVDYITRLGRDGFSDRIADFIAAEGIGTGRIARAPEGKPGLYAITTDAAGERSFTYWRDNSAARRMFADGEFDLLDGYDLVYLSAISLAILPAQVRAALLDEITRRGIAMAFDSNYRPRLWESADAARETVAAYWARSAIALPSIDDEMALFQEDAAQVARRLRALPAIGALKRGPCGPLAIGAEVVQDYPPAARVVDTTAAGDSFNGGWLAAHLTGAEPAAALRAGHALAARVVGHRGAIIPKDAM